MASIVEKRLSDGQSAYLVRWRNPDDNRQRSEQFRRKTDAVRKARTVEASKDAGTYLDPRAGRMTLQEFWDDWSPSAYATLARNTVYQQRRSFENHAVPRFGSTPLFRITQLDVAKWVADLSASELKPATVRLAHLVLSKTLGAAVDAGRLRRNPAQGVRLPTITRAEKRVLSGAEVERLAEAIDPRFCLFVWLGAYCGLRTGEMRGLRWSDIDCDTRWLHVRRQVTEVGGVQEETLVLKTSAAHRRVPVPRFLLETLKLYRNDAPNTDLVIPGPEGGPLRTTFAARFFEPACVRARIGHFSPHELRHTAITRWVSQGALPQDVARWAGHSTVAQVLDLYTHYEESAAERVRASLDAYARSESAHHMDRR
jgi:integrase